MPAAKPTIVDFFHKDTYTCAFICYDEATKDAIVIDPVMDFDPINWQVSNTHNDLMLAFIAEKQLKVHFIMDTHVHADHLTGMAYMKKKLGGAVPTCIGEHITVVQKTFSGLFGLTDFKCDGSQFDMLLKDNQVLHAGSLQITCWATPGHTPNCMCYIVGDAVFTGDLMFTEDFGCGRCDFPGGNAADMYDSVMRVYNNLPGETRVFVGHDYQPGGRPLRVSSTVQLEADKQEDLPRSGKKEDFVKGKSEYDKTLNFPRLIFQSLLVNIAAGHLPPANANGHRHFVIPMNLKMATDDIGVPLK